MIYSKQETQQAISLLLGKLHFNCEVKDGGTQENEDGILEDVLIIEDFMEIWFHPISSVEIVRAIVPRPSKRDTIEYSFFPIGAEGSDYLGNPLMDINGTPDTAYGLSCCLKVIAQVITDNIIRNILN